MHPCATPFQGCAQAYTAPLRRHQQPRPQRAPPSCCLSVPPGWTPGSHRCMLSGVTAPGTAIRGLLGPRPLWPKGRRAETRCLWFPFPRRWRSALQVARPCPWTLGVAHPIRERQCPSCRVTVNIFSKTAQVFVPQSSPHPQPLCGGWDCSAAPPWSRPPSAPSEGQPHALGLPREDRRPPLLLHRLRSLPSSGVTRGY